MNAFKMSIMLLLVALLWLAGAVVFFILYFLWKGIITLTVPILMLVMSVLAFGVYFLLRRLLSDQTRKQK